MAVFGCRTLDHIQVTREDATPPLDTPVIGTLGVDD